MSDPTQTQIQAAVALPTFLVEIFTGSWVDISADVVEVSDDILSSAGPNGLAFGTTVGPRLTVTLDAAARFADAWRLAPIRVGYGFGGSGTPLRFTGIVLDRDTDGVTLTLECGGWDELIRRTAVRTPLRYRRPAATATSVSSVENPANSLYRAGIINEILWRCGGRPLQQAASYPNATFYYETTHSAITPEWSWVNAEDAWEELGRICRACGGQVYQDAAGVIRYVDPLSFAEGSATHLYSDAASTAASRVSGNVSDYGGIGVQESAREQYSVISATFAQRRVQGSQRVYQDTTPQPIEASDSITINLDTQLPLLIVDSITVIASRSRGGDQLTPAQLPVTTVETFAQRITIEVENTLAEPVCIYAIEMVGQPLAVIEEGNASYSTADIGPFAPELKLEDSAYVQSDLHAAQLCRMRSDFEGAVNQRTVTLDGCGYDPDRDVGEIVTITNSALGLSAVAHRIVNQRVADTGVSMALDCAPVAGLPKRSDFWLIGVTYTGSATRQLSY